MTIYRQTDRSSANAMACLCGCFIALLALVLPVALCAQTVSSYTSGGYTLYYEEIGRGPALYILSGGPGEAPDTPYRQIADSLSQHFTCVLVHQRASGRSRLVPANATTITIANYTNDIEALRQHRGDNKIWLLGMSWGGLLAQNYAAQYPKRTAGLLLVCSAPPSYKLWNFLYDNQHARRSAVELDSMARLQKIFANTSERELDSLKRADPAHPKVVAYKAFIWIHVRAMYYDRAKIVRQHFDELFDTFNFQPIPLIDQEVLATRWDITDRLKKLKIPALIVYGRQDDQGESTFYLQQECLRGSEMHVIEQCGHEIVEEQPAEFFRILMAYVREQKEE